MVISIHMHFLLPHHSDMLLIMELHYHPATSAIGTIQCKSALGLFVSPTTPPSPFDEGVIPAVKYPVHYLNSLID